HIWNEGLDGWKPPRQVPAVASELHARQRAAVPVPPPPPRPRAITGGASQPGAPRMTGSGPVSSSSANLAGTGPHAAAAASLSSPHPLDRAANGVDGHAGASMAGAGASPSALLPNGESDAMNALNLAMPRPSQGSAAGLPGSTS